LGKVIKKVLAHIWKGISTFQAPTQLTIHGMVLMVAPAASYIPIHLPLLLTTS
jgi:hypothetical protein